MRLASADGYDEPRDALARDWAGFLAWAAPEAVWVPVPNAGYAAAGRFVEALALDGIVLTGGEDVGTDALRDDTEQRLLEESVRRGIPLFGVCRGLQHLLRFYGLRELSRLPGSPHAGGSHRVRFTPHLPGGSPAAGEVEVNSFHRNGIASEHVPAACEVTALSDDGWVEGARSRASPLSGVLWHPERGRPFRETDRRIFRHALHLD